MVGAVAETEQGILREVKREAFADDKELFDFNIPNGDIQNTNKE
jgi:uncharacterized ubiquitin-like protein YukD